MYKLLTILDYKLITFRPLLFHPKLWPCPCCIFMFAFMCLFTYYIVSISWEEYNPIKTYNWSQRNAKLFLLFTFTLIIFFYLKFSAINKKIFTTINVEILKTLIWDDPLQPSSKHWHCISAWSSLSALKQFWLDLIQPHDRTVRLRLSAYFTFWKK